MASPCHGGWKNVNTWRIGIIGVGYMIATKDWHHLTWCLWSSTIIDQQDAMHMQMTYETCAMWICRYCMCAEVLLVYMAAMAHRPFTVFCAGDFWRHPLEGVDGPTGGEHGQLGAGGLRGLHRQQTRMLEQTMGIYGNIRYISNQNGIYIPTYPYNPHMIHYEDCIWGLYGYVGKYLRIWGYNWLTHLWWSHAICHWYWENMGHGYAADMPFPSRSLDPAMTAITFLMGSVWVWHLRCWNSFW